jgi:hypothetical protein
MPQSWLRKKDNAETPTTKKPPSCETQGEIAIVLPF